MDRLSIEFICAMGMPPDDFVRLAADLGVSQVGLAPHRITDNPYGFRDWSLLSDIALASASKSAMAATGVTLSQGEGFLVMADSEIASSEPLMDLMAGFGAPSVNCVVLEQDRSRAIDQFAAFAAMAAERGMTATLEFMPLMWPANLTDALALIDEAGAENGKLMLDAMHVFRSGATVHDVAALDPARIGYIQLCDVPTVQDGGGMTPQMMQDYGEVARHERLCPGDGDLPLAEFLKALPRDLPAGLEIPMLSKAKAGIAPEQSLRPCVAAARALLAEAID